MKYPDVVKKKGFLREDFSMDGKTFCARFGTFISDGMVIVWSVFW